jgi:hypothetical protein
LGGGGFGQSAASQPTFDAFEVATIKPTAPCRAELFRDILVATVEEEAVANVEIPKKEKGPEARSAGGKMMCDDGQG